MENTRHNLSIHGIPGIITGVILTVLIFCLYYLFEFYALGESGIAFLPISFFEIFIVVVVFLFILLSYFCIVLINKKLRKKIGVKGWEQAAKTIRKRFLFYATVGLIFAYLAATFGYLKIIIPSALALYGLYCIRIQHFTTGNTNILGLFFVLQSIVAYLIPTASFIIAGISFGGFHLAYAVLSRTIPSRQHNPADS